MTLDPWSSTHDDLWNSVMSLTHIYCVLKAGKTFRAAPQWPSNPSLDTRKGWRIAPRKLRHPCGTKYKGCRTWCQLTTPREEDDDLLEQAPKQSEMSAFACMPLWSYLDEPNERRNPQNCSEAHARNEEYYSCCYETGWASGSTGPAAGTI